MATLGSLLYTSKRCLWILPSKGRLGPLKRKLDAALPDSNCTLYPKYIQHPITRARVQLLPVNISFRRLLAPPMRAPAALADSLMSAIRCGNFFKLLHQMCNDDSDTFGSVIDCNWTLCTKYIQDPIMHSSRYTRRQHLRTSRECTCRQFNVLN